MKSDESKVDALRLGVVEPVGSGKTALVAELCPMTLEPLAEKLHAALSELPRALASASATGSGLCAVRVLARDATTLYRALNACRALARSYLGLKPAAQEVWWCRRDRANNHAACGRSWTRRRERTTTGCSAVL